MPWQKVTSMEERNRFVALAESGAETVSELCRRFGVSRETGYKWLACKRDHGLEGLRDRSRRPRSNARSVDEGTVKLIVRLERRHPRWGPKKIRRGLVSRRRRRPRVDRPAWEGLAEAKRPNHVWAVDFKGWFTPLRALCWRIVSGHECCNVTTIMSACALGRAAFFGGSGGGAVGGGGL